MTYLDTRDLFDELLDLRYRKSEAEDSDALGSEVEPLDEDETERLAALEELADEIGEDTLRNGETMIPESDFTEYAQELAEDIVPDFDRRSSNWPFSHIDWDAAARELAYDYSSVVFDGTFYYVRTY